MKAKYAKIRMFVPVGMALKNLIAGLIWGYEMLRKMMANPVVKLAPFVIALPAEAARFLIS